MSIKDEANTLLKVRGLHFRYSATTPFVLDDLELNLFQNQTLGIFGPNGSGKTTLFKCITGLLKAETGNIFINERLVKSEKDFIALRKVVGFVLQDADDQIFFPTVGEDLAFGPLNLGLDPDQAAQRSNEALNLVGLNGFAKRLISHLSGGEKKLVSIASILAMQPRALLLDEPLNALDTEAIGRICELIKNLPCAKIIISHDFNFLKQYTETVLLMEKGQLHFLNA